MTFGNRKKIPVYREVPVANNLARYIFLHKVTICRVYATKWLFRSFYGYFFFANDCTKGLRTWDTMQWKILLLSCDLFYLHNLPCNPLPYCCTVPCLPSQNAVRLEEFLVLGDAQYWGSKLPTSIELKNYLIKHIFQNRVDFL